MSSDHEDSSTVSYGHSVSDSQLGGVPTGRTSASGSMTPLPDDFNPGPDDVVCGRGKKCYNHVGNERFRKRVITFLDEYSRAKSKLDKSTVLSKVVEEVRQHSPKGGFVKQDASGRWHEVGDFLAREKTSQAFRDALHERYKSSNVSKKKRRKEEQARSTHAFSKVGRSDYEISSRLERISNEVLGAHGMHIQDSFNRSNYEMLSQLNRMSRHPGASSSRRYSISGSSHADHYRSLQQPSHHFPDPLFGSTVNAANAMPSEYGGEKLSPAEPYRHRSYSYNSAPDAPGEPLVAAPDETEAFHHSLPEIPTVYEGKDPFDDSLTLHRSAPELPISKHDEDEDQKLPARQYVEPVPLHRINLPPSGQAKEVPVVKKPPPFAAPLPLRSGGPDDMHISSSSSSGRSSGGGGRISKDLMECLDKMTYHSIADDNPFEPIPLSPEQEKRLATKNKKSGASELFPRNPLDDMSERDEFAEG